MGVASAAAYQKGAVSAQSFGGVANNTRSGLSTNSRQLAGYSDKHKPKVIDSEQPPVVVCAGTTVGGTGCKARPVHGAHLCYGHGRQQAKRDAESEQ